MNELREKIGDFQIVDKGDSIEISHPENEINSVLQKKFLPYQLLVYIQSQPINKELECSKECELVKCQELHDKIKELERENESLKFKLKKKEQKYQSASNQITQLQKERDELLEGISEIREMWSLDTVDEKCLELLTNKTDEQ